MTNNYVVFDLETTGFSSKRDKIIQIAAIKYFNGEISTFNEYIKQDFPLPNKIVELTGINDNTLNELGIKPQKAMILFNAFILNLPLVGHNCLNFDRLFIEEYFDNYNLKIPSRDRYEDTALKYLQYNGYKFSFDTFKYKFYCRSTKYNLQYCLSYYNIDSKTNYFHQADIDCIFTNLLYRKIVLNDDTNKYPLEVLR